MSSDGEQKLLDAFDIRVEQLDYGFLKECEDDKTIERIIRILRSGEEGLYPDLLKFAEDRLAEVNPESRMLLEDQPAVHIQDLPADLLQSLEADMEAWSAKVKAEEDDLTSLEVIRGPLPPVRGSARAGSAPPRISSEEIQRLLQEAQNYLQDDDFFQASVRYQKVLECEPGHPGALQGMAKVHDHQGLNRRLSDGGGCGRSSRVVQEV
ncbi:sperm-associated antigen 1-like [Penaeus chinensis]|uniref:sperm-associated antigen 1-like n=1 Tax=Penaeus chinensis TaxID=139456 RepID=UPI001FB7FC34|nr:sperm-associated antigen 1-like [Penaeus chinensis]XP_047490631.1 sperm-associated antigen 1-like [Penaeus chinensis]XP_047490632.1 sperm-associated antigen 1-like [Penaeus chinensis]